MSILLLSYDIVIPFKIKRGEEEINFSS